MADTIAEQGAIRQGIQDALNGVTPNAQTTAGFANNVIRQYLNGTIRFDGNRQTPRGRIIGYMLNNNLFVDFGISGATLDSRITFTRASTKTYFDSTGTLQTAAINEWPVEYDPSTLQPLGRSVWEQRTNKSVRNNMAGAAVGVIGSGGAVPTGWAVQGTGLTIEVVALGTENGIPYIDIRYSGTAGANFATVSFGTVTGYVDSTTYAMSTYLKRIAGTFTAFTSVAQRIRTNLSAGGSSDVILDNLPSAIPSSGELRNARIAAAGAVPTGLTGAGISFIQFSFPVSTAVDFTIRVGGNQLEAGAFATPLIFTSGAEATRAADVASVTGTNFSSWYNQNEGTLVAEASGKVTGTTGSNRVTISDGTAANRLQMFVSTSNNVQTQLADNSVTVVSVIGLGSAVEGTTYKQAFAYKTGDSATSVNGNAPVTGSGAFSITEMNQMRIGARQDSVSYLNGWIRSIAYYPVRLPNTQLQALTT